MKVSYYRKRKGYTQEQMAAKMEVATSFIGQIEAPNIYKSISLDTLFRIARILEVEPYKFLIFD
ncbi:helix-turn-helix transcriptional regulator [Clostridium sp. KNHs205]|uniref:helix-turn-helix domain-containing protein n=1 Tax=Clostridium sp. KNHs205 TaxID=1449050 RepID=UPI002418B5C1|nr:helix-turn-helix transcriptional regulator [Clostridium sp. KNHs205]